MKDLNKQRSKTLKEAVAGHAERREEKKKAGRCQHLNRSNKFVFKPHLQGRSRELFMGCENINLILSFNKIKYILL